MQSAPESPAALDPTTRQWLETEVVPAQRIIDSFRLKGGINNDMRAVRTRADRRLVVRSYRASTGEAVCRKEVALADRLADTGTVPAVLAADPDGRIDGVPRSVWEYVHGERLDVLLPAVGHDGAVALGRAVGSTLARLGTVRFAAPGALGDGRLIPDGRPVLCDLFGAVTAVLDRAPREDRRLSAGERDRLRTLAARSEPEIDRVLDARTLVHMDFNPKNVIVARLNGVWSVSAVVDWELAHSGSPLTDVGNMLRFCGEYPPGFCSGFLTGFRDGGGDLPRRWRPISMALDLFTLVEMLADLPRGPTLDRVVALLRRRLACVAH